MVSEAECVVHVGREWNNTCLVSISFTFSHVFFFFFTCVCLH